VRNIPSIGILIVALCTMGADGGDNAALSLDGLLHAALAHDGRVLAAQAELGEYRAKFDQARWLWFPVIKIEGMIGGPVSERRLACDPDNDPVCSGLEVSSASKGGDFDFGNLGLAMGGKIEGYLPIYTFGKISSAKQAAAAGMRAGRAGIERARQEVALEVRRAYYGWLLADSAVEVLEDGDKKIKEVEKKLIKMLDDLNEDVTDRDLFKLRYYAARVKSLLAQTRSGQAVALAALRFLTGIEYLGTKRQLLVVELEAPDFKTLPRTAYLARARARRPELTMLTAGLEARRASVEIEKAGFYPDFFVGGYFQGSWSWVQDFIENPLLNAGLTTYGGALMVGFRITLDIPQKLARLAEARASLSKIEALANQAEQAVGLEIDRRLEDVRTTYADQKIQKKGHRAAKAWMRANFMSYGVGISDTKDLLDSIAAHANSKIGLTKLRHDILVALDRLHAASGEDLSRAPKNGK